jgi:hypothetical protein
MVSGQAARAAGPQRHATFAVVIGNNRSLGGRRPDLHYADDDAAKYFAILRTIADVSLLADFDGDTARLFPVARALAVAPTRAELLRLGRELAERVRKVTDAGGEADVYFVFAGHGDVDAGQGFIELTDARFTSSDLVQWLRAIPFTRGHVILDSCNSFFMLGARGPGGRYSATSEDAARSLSAKLPNVGVFLSTSAEGEAFEWSEIQSGVFSYVVRSGLLGGADADGDGIITYRELAAFVSTATADVKNPNMRPHVFARGPGGRDEVPIVSGAARSGARALRLTGAGSLHVRMRDREAVPLFDANVEQGASVTMKIPDEWVEGAEVERAGVPSAPIELFSVPPGNDAVTLAELEPLQARGAARGPAEIFQSLFARPFGPRAVFAYMAAARTEAPQVYGVTREDAERMALLLGQIESAERSQRLLTGSIVVGTGAVLGVVGGSILSFGLSGATRASSNAWGATYLGIGALELGGGLYTLVAPWSGEQAAQDYRSALGSGTDYVRAFAAAEGRLRDLSAREARARWFRGGVGALLVAGSISAIVYGELTATSSSARLQDRAFGGTGIVVGGALLASTLIELPVQRLTTIGEHDPGMLHLQPTVAPTQGGAVLGVVGSF